MSARNLENSTSNGTRASNGVASSMYPAAWTLGARSRPRRSLRVLYPPLVKRPQLKQEEPNPVKRWLLVLSAVLFLQVYIEEVPEGPEDPHHSSLEGPQFAALERLHLCSQEEPLQPHLCSLEGPQTQHLLALEVEQGPQAFIKDAQEGNPTIPSIEASAQTRALGSQELNPLPAEDTELVTGRVEKNQSAPMNSSV